MKNLLRVLLASTLAGGVALAFAQAGKYPTKPIRLVVPFSAASQTDATARLMGQKLTQAFGEQVVVDNRTGAGGMLGMQVVANAVPDGYTLLFHSSAFSIGPHLYPKMGIDIARSFQAVTLISASPHVIVVWPQLGPKTLKDLIDHARKQGDIIWSHAGAGSSTHLVGEKFFIEARLKHTGVAYKGAPEAVTDAIAGRVALSFPAAGQIAPFVQDGRVTALAVTAKERSSVLPNVPTTAESGMPGFEYEVWFLVAAPGKTPKPIVDRLSEELRRALVQPDVKRALDTMGSVARPMTPEEAQRYAVKEYETLGNIIRIAKVPIN